MKVALRVLIVGVCAVWGMNGWAQLVFYQDVIQGGATAGGFSTGMGAGGGEVSLYIEPESEINRAFLFAFSTFDANKILYVNNTEFRFNSENRLTTFGNLNTAFTPIHLHVIDITTYITTWWQNNSSASFSFEVPPQSGMPFEAVFAPFLFVVYKNSNLPVFNTTIICNTQEQLGNEIYNIENLNPVNTVVPVSFSLYTDRTGSGFTETNEVYFNSNFLGIVGGSDNVNWQWNGAGVKGHFYYQNNQLFGLDDDVANNTMSGTDGLADVSDYLENNATSCTFRLQHINYPFQIPAASNVNLAYTFAYTTPCQPFETTLTDDVELCRGDTAHLLATGGIEY